MDKQFPNKLYKYKGIQDKIDFDRIIDIIESEKIYIPTREELNDPLEGAHIPPVRYGICGGWNYDARHQIPHYAENIINQYRILSLSADERNMQMWAHYGNNYEGVCFEFSTNGVFGKAKPVNYDEAPIGEALYEPNEEELKKVIENGYFYKSKGWESEKEYRIITDYSCSELKFDRKDILSIFIGHNVADEYRDILYDTCKRYNIPVYCTWFGNYDYKLYLIEIEAILNEKWQDGKDILYYEKDEAIRKYMK